MLLPGVEGAVVVVIKSDAKRVTVHQLLYRLIKEKVSAGVSPTLVAPEEYCQQLQSVGSDVEAPFLEHRGM